MPDPGMPVKSLLAQRYTLRCKTTGPAGGARPGPMQSKRNNAVAAPDTRERILDASLELFNADGSHAVSTRHIAARLGISPGNLYYHFANKEEIVLCLYGRIESELEAILGQPDQTARTFDDVLGYLDKIFAHLWSFRFFYRDLNALLGEVPKLRDRYRELAERVHAQSRRIFAAMVEAGWMEASDEYLDLLATNAWIVLTQWFTHRQVVERRRSIQSSDIQDGIRHFVALFSPLLRAPQRRQLQRAIETAA
jgi:AcrR family transcriptional regulator